LKAFQQPLSEAEEARLLKLLKNGNEEEKAYAKDELVIRNMRLVAFVARRIQPNGAELDDMIGAGAIGLIKAVTNLDQDRGRKLVTFASTCIENEIRMMLRLLKKHTGVISIYESVGNDKEGNEICLVDVIEDTNCPDTFETISKEEDIKRLRRLRKKILSDLEYKVLKLRYGLDNPDYTELTQRDVGKIIGYSRSYVSRIEKKALAKLRNEF